MDLRLGVNTLSAIALSLLIAPAFSLANPAQQTQTVQVSQSAQELGNCLQLAKQGDNKAAFEKAKEVREVYSQERMFDVSYVNTLVSIAGDETDVDVDIVNEAIDAVNTARLKKIYDGHGDPEIAFHFMKSLAELGETVERVSEPIAANIRVYEGRIANNLRENSSYPKNALEALANPMIDMAEGYAEQKKTELVFKSIESAVKCGYGDYRNLAKQEWFKSSVDAKLAKSWMASFDVQVTRTRSMLGASKLFASFRARTLNSHFGILMAAWFPKVTTRRESFGGGPVGNLVPTLSQRYSRLHQASEESQKRRSCCSGNFNGCSRNAR